MNVGGDRNRLVNNTQPSRMRRALSSRTTFLWNFVLPIVLMGGLSCLLLLCWLGKISGKDGKPMSIEVLCVFTLMWALVMLGLVKSLGFLKRVEVDDHALYLSNHLTEVRIPLSEIADVRETGGSKSLTRVSISFRRSSPFGKSIEFLPRLSLHLSADPVVREVQALRKQASAVEGVGIATPFDTTEKVFEAGDDCVQVGKDYLLYGCEGKDEVCERDKFFFQDLAQITVIRRKKSGRTTSVAYKVKGKSGTFEIEGFTPKEMEEIAHLLRERTRSWPVQFVEKESSGSSLVGLIIAGVGAIAATIGSGWLLYFGWSVREQLESAIGFTLYGVICLGALGVAAALWAAFWRCLRN
jgi:hypothetical protein